VLGWIAQFTDCQHAEPFEAKQAFIHGAAGAIEFRLIPSDHGQRLGFPAEVVERHAGLIQNDVEGRPKRLLVKV